MDKIFQEALRCMETAFQRIEGQVPPPQFIEVNGQPVFRYTEKTIHQAIIQKLARVLSGLSAAWVLLVNGFVQEQGAIQRTLDDFYEDIQFLALAVTNDKITNLHTAFLHEFYMEEFDVGSSSPTSYPKRPMVPRDKIRAYCNRILSPKDPSTPNALRTKLQKAYSGFVHGASPHIMDMYGGSPPHFHTRGLRGTSRIAEHHQDLSNYFYRALLSFLTGAKAFGDRDLAELITKTINVFQEHFGEDLIKAPKKQS